MCATLPLCALGVGTSIVAYNSETNKIEGCILSIVESSMGVINDVSTPDCFLPIYGVLSRLNETAPNQRHHELDKDQILHIFMVAVDSVHAGRGYSLLLIQENVKIAAKLGFRLATVEATVPPSLKSFLRADFVIQHHLSYSTFHFKGSYPFAALEGGVTLLTKGLHL